MPSLDDELRAVTEEGDSPSPAADTEDSQLHTGGAPLDNSGRDADSTSEVPQDTENATERETETSTQDVTDETPLDVRGDPLGSSWNVSSLVADETFQVLSQIANVADLPSDEGQTTTGEVSGQVSAEINAHLDQHRADAARFVTVLSEQVLPALRMYSGQAETAALTGGLTGAIGAALMTGGAQAGNPSADSLMMLAAQELSTIFTSDTVYAGSAGGEREIERADEPESESVDAVTGGQGHDGTETESLASGDMSTATTGSAAPMTGGMPSAMPMSGAQMGTGLSSASPMSMPMAGGMPMAGMPVTGTGAGASRQGSAPSGGGTGISRGDLEKMISDARSRISSENSSRSSSSPSSSSSSSSGSGSSSGPSPRAPSPSLNTVPSGGSPDSVQGSNNQAHLQGDRAAGKGQTIAGTPVEQPRSASGGRPGAETSLSATAPPAAGAQGGGAGARPMGGMGMMPMGGAMGAMNAMNSANDQKGSQFDAPLTHSMSDMADDLQVGAVRSGVIRPGQELTDDDLAAPVRRTPAEQPETETSVFRRGLFGS